ncbi:MULTISPECIES: enoyl-CoA hydratase/isomerase family protein [unclassified Roseitalea]|uniref:enoyl-CoA hydratase/isomerase family protein n=1 Tax=unclassified Roseitalea TaxID=2639107 RepID=UPI00273FC0BC|nr:MULTISPECIES: enoyl-CoA hydratase/isomerase family protein [unclassified Roseitalea]
MDATRNPIIVEPREGFAVLTLNRPERRNALDRQTMRALDRTLDECAADQACRALVLTGAPPAFCAGSDLKELGGLSVAAMAAHEAETAAVVRRFAHRPFPIVAAVEGYALGGGLALAAACDLVVTARTAKWAMPEVANGWLPPWGLQPVAARTGPVRARAICWGATSIDGAEAHRLGLADLLAGDGEALGQACSLAAALAALPAEAVAATKRYFSTAIAADAETLDAEAGRLFAENCSGAAARATLDRFAGRP